jgi:Protein of unknown function (DUF3999)
MAGDLRQVRPFLYSPLVNGERSVVRRPVLPVVKRRGSISKSLSCITILLLHVNIISADFRRSDWQFSKAIEAGTAQANDYIRVSVDGQTFHRSLRSLADLRIVDDKGSEVPYALSEERAKTTEEQFYPKVFNQAVLPGKYSTLTLDLEKEIANNTLTLKTKNQNFKRRVEIAGSQDGKQWLVLRDDAYIFDFSGEPKVQLTTVKYPEHRYRYLRVRVWNEQEPPLQIEGASLSLVTKTTPRRIIHPSTLLSREEDSKLKASVVRLDLSYEKLPSDLLTIKTPEQNFSRRVEILGSNDQKTWQSLLQSDLYRFRTAKYSVEKETLHFPEARHRYLKVIIHNQDDPPLKLEALEVQGIEKDLIFQFQPGRQNSLYYGSPNAQAPKYDIERVKSYLNLDSLPRAQLGVESENRDYRPSSPKRPWTETQPILFWVVLILLVTSLGTYILRLMTKVKTAS